MPRRCSHMRIALASKGPYTTLVCRGWCFSPGLRRCCRQVVEIMAESPPVESVFLANLAAIDRIISVACRRFSLRPDAGSDFASWVKLKLIEDDYAVFRKFRGESAITTYLTVVITMLF